MSFLVSTDNYLKVIIIIINENKCVDFEPWFVVAFDETILICYDFDWCGQVISGIISQKSKLLGTGHLVIS